MVRSDWGGGGSSGRVSGVGGAENRRRRNSASSSGKMLPLGALAGAVGRRCAVSDMSEALPLADSLQTNFSGESRSHVRTADEHVPSREAILRKTSVRRSRREGVTGIRAKSDRDPRLEGKGSAVAKMEAAEERLADEYVQEFVLDHLEDAVKREGVDDDGSCASPAHLQQPAPGSMVLRAHPRLLPPPPLASVAHPAGSLPPTPSAHLTLIGGHGGLERTPLYTQHQHLRHQIPQGHLPGSPATVTSTTPSSSSPPSSTSSAPQLIPVSPGRAPSTPAPTPSTPGDEAMHPHGLHGPATPGSPPETPPSVPLVRHQGTLPPFSSTHPSHHHLHPPNPHHIIHHPESPPQHHPQHLQHQQQNCPPPPPPPPPLHSAPNVSQKTPVIGEEVIWLPNIMRYNGGVQEPLDLRNESMEVVTWGRNLASSPHHLQHSQHQLALLGEEGAATPPPQPHQFMQIQQQPHHHHLPLQLQHQQQPMQGQPLPPLPHHHHHHHHAQGNQHHAGNGTLVVSSTISSSSSSSASSTGSANSFLHDEHNTTGTGGSPGSAATPSFLNDDLLMSLSVRELNKRLHGCPRDEVVRLKQKRRTLKNRGYAQNCRSKRLAQRHELETQNRSLQAELTRIRMELGRVAQERDMFRQRYDLLMRRSGGQLPPPPPPPPVTSVAEDTSLRRPIVGGGSEVADLLARRNGGGTPQHQAPHHQNAGNGRMGGCGPRGARGDRDANGGSDGMNSSGSPSDPPSSPEDNFKTLVKSGRSLKCDTGVERTRKYIFFRLTISCVGYALRIDLDDRLAVDSFGAPDRTPSADSLFPLPI
ncbi:hypothetical protein J437_LFUL013696 [Ladona fulva]|uniref:BZIP domain-containing protein n=1 Tax=Ladona fulva TaxID=123851 RepID=A0A8K0KEY3_LADFU|nr:hypothetical protein J437_LFUL013696 [Ladona fulva]